MKTKYNVLLVDDEPNNLKSTQLLLERWGYGVWTANSCDEALVLLREPAAEFAMVLVDYRMPGKNGAETVREIREINQDAVVAMYSCDDSRDAALTSQRAGAVDFIDKDDVSYLRDSLERGCRKFEESRTVQSIVPADEAARLIAAQGMVGCSPSLAEVAKKVDVFKDSRATVLITGESGVGKELVAKAIHGAKGQFVAINCATFGRDGNLLESELFGHEKGAFTGALNRKVGLLEAARGGTVFLDEIHHMSLSAQAQLLRAVDEKRIRRLGGNEEYPIEFRLIVATKPDIEQRVKDGTFLEDLYFRVRCLTVKVPALRERPEDIAPLVAHFCQKHFEETGHKKTFLMRAVRVLENHDWPGNVRDLQWYVRSLLTQTTEATIDSKHLDLQFFETGSYKAPAQSYAELEARQERERREFIRSALKRWKRPTWAAEKLNVPVTTLRSMMDRLGIAK